MYVVPGPVLSCDRCSRETASTMFLEHTTLLCMYVCMYVSIIRVSIHWCMYVCMYSTWGDEVVYFPDLGVGHVQQDVDSVLLLLDGDLIAAYLVTHTYIHTYIDRWKDKYNFRNAAIHTYIHVYKFMLKETLYI